MNYGAGQFEHDLEKAKSREKIKETIARVFPEDRANLRVAFLTGPSLIEYDQVYAPLGIRPENAYGIEMDPSAFASVNAQNCARKEPIKLYHGKDIDFFRDAKPLDVICLDYLQNYGPAILDSLDAVFDPKEPKVTDKSILVVNAQARRESPKYQARLLGILTLAGSLNSNYFKFYDHAIHEALGMPETPREKTIDNIGGVLAGLLNGATCKKPWKYTSLLEVLRHSLLEEVVTRTRYLPIRAIPRSDFAARIAGEDAQTVTDYLELLQPMMRTGPFLDSLELAAVVSVLDMKSVLSVSQGMVIPVDMLAYARHRANNLEVTNHEVFDYTSASGTPMLQQIFTIEKDSHFRQWLTQAHELGLRMKKFMNPSIPKYRALRPIIEAAMEGKVSFKVLKKFRAGRELEQHLPTAVGMQVSFIDALQKDYATMIGIARREQAHIRFINSNMSDLGEWDIPEEDQATQTLTPVPVVAPAAPNAVTTSVTIATPTQVIATPLAQQETSSATQTSISRDDKQTIRALHAEGFSAADIHANFFANTGVSIQQIRAICAWNKIYADRAERK